MTNSVSKDLKIAQGIADSLQSYYQPVYTNHILWSHLIDLILIYFQMLRSSCNAEISFNLLIHLWDHILGEKSLLGRVA